jgi:hypothetical protein
MLRCIHSGVGQSHASSNALRQPPSRLRRAFSQPPGSLNITIMPDPQAARHGNALKRGKPSERADRVRFPARQQTIPAGRSPGRRMAHAAATDPRRHLVVGEGVIAAFPLPAPVSGPDNERPAS